MKLTVEKLVKRFPGHPAPVVNEFDLQVDGGEILCLAGESGCGKTTVLRLLAGLEVAESGRIVLADRVLVDDRVWVPPEQRGVGMVFQDYALFPHLRVSRNVRFGLKHLPRAEQRRRVTEMLALTQLGELADRYPHALSGGQRQRVALARALAPSPPLLLLDEAFCSLDRELRGQMLDEVRELLKQTGTTAVCVTHDLEDALAIADRLAVMRAGRIVQTGTARTLYETPADAGVARLFGEINLIPGTLADGWVETPLGRWRPRSVAAGQRGVAVVRPHELRLGAEAAGVPGRVSHLRFRADGLELRVSLPSLPGQELAMRVPEEFRLAVGDTVRVEPNAPAVPFIPAE